MKELFYAVCVLAVLSATPVSAQEAKTDPFEMVHPTTGESGVWVPQWLQRIELQRREDLHVCVEVKKLTAEVLREKLLEVESLRAEGAETRAASEKLKEQLTAEVVRREKADARASTSNTVAWASASGGGVAILAMILLHVL